MGKITRQGRAIIPASLGVGEFLESAGGPLRMSCRQLTKPFGSGRSVLLTLKILFRDSPLLGNYAFVTLESVEAIWGAGISPAPA